MADEHPNQISIPEQRAQGVLELMEEELTLLEHNRQMAWETLIQYLFLQSSDSMDADEILNKGIHQMEVVINGNWATSDDLDLSSRCLYDGFKRTGDLETLQRTIKYSQAALNATPKTGPHFVERAYRHGMWLISLYDRTGKSEDLDCVIRHFQSYLRAISGNHGHPPSAVPMLHNLGKYLVRRYEQSDNLDDLNEAIKQFEAAIELTPEDQKDRGWMLHNLANCLYGKYHETADVANLEAAIRYAEEAIKGISENHPDRPQLLGLLGKYLSFLSDRTGKIDALETGIMYTESAIRTMPENAQQKPGLLEQLGKLLNDRYVRTGNLSDLEIAITHLVAASKIVRRESDPDFSYARILDSLSRILYFRYQRRRHMADLQAAIYYLTTAIKAVPEDYPDRPVMWSGLGNLFSSTYLVTRDLADIDSAIVCAAEATEGVPADHPDLPHMLTSLGVHVHRKYSQTGNLSQLEDAIKCTTEAIKRMPKDYPHRAAALSNLGWDLESLYQKTGNLIHLEDAIKNLEDAIEVIPDNHLHRPDIWDLLGECYELHSEAIRTNDSARATEGFQKSLAAYCRSWGFKNGHLLIRLQSALSGAKLLAFNPFIKDSEQAYSLLRDALHLLPHATPRSLARTDQQNVLSRLNDLAAFAAAMALETGHSPFEALRLLELGRTVTNGQLLDYRSDISDLEEQYPSLAASFKSMRAQLDSSFPSLKEIRHHMSVEHMQSHQADVDQRNKIAEQLERLLQEIRQQPGFESFLLPSTQEYFLSAAKHGPIIVLNVTPLRSDAILVRKDDITSMPLPQLSYESAKQHLYPPSNEVNADFGRENDITRKLLNWLWQVAVQPVLQALGLYQISKSASSTYNAPDHPLPRVWWIGVGLMAKAPIHAAAKFTRARLQPQMSTLQFCIPSYTPTIRALMYSRRAQDQANTPGRDILLVTMPTTPGESPLSRVDDEVKDVETNFRNTCRVLVLPRPTSKEVLEQLPRSSIVHFACHGVSNLNPAKSHLLLVKKSHTADGGHKEKVDKLYVTDIAAMKLSSRLAYLSACSTAHNTAPKLADEATHLVSSFQLAGFGNVIGTMWQAEDEACSHMAAEFYTSLRKSDNIATAYYEAVLKLRAKKPAQPMYWAPFVYWGA